MTHYEGVGDTPLTGNGLQRVRWRRYEIESYLIHPDRSERKTRRDLPRVWSAAVNVHEVPEPILNSPFEEPKEHWRITEHEPPQRIAGRRPTMYFYRPPGHESSVEQQGVGTAIGLKLVNRIRTQLADWRPLALRGEGGVSRTTMELLRYWRREGRKHGCSLLSSKPLKR